MTIKDKAAIVGIGKTQFYRRGQSWPAESELSLACKAILAALDDAGLTVMDLDGFALYSHGYEPADLAAALGMPEVRFTSCLTGGGGPSGAAVGGAAAAIHGGMAECVVTLMTLQQHNRRLGGRAVPAPDGGSALSFYNGVTPGYAATIGAFTTGNGLLSPGHASALITRRHMELYGTSREAFCELAISSRDNALQMPDAIMKTPLTRDDYFNARIIAEPLCLFDYCLETDGAVACVTVSAERAKDLRHPPVYIMASAHGGPGRTGPQNWKWLQMAEEDLVSSGSWYPARRLYEMAGVGPEDVDVALLYDNFLPMVVLQLEDYGFVPKGEGGPFVEAGNIRYKTGSLPVNTHGGNHSHAYVIGMTHVYEAVEQLRGTAVNQVDGAEVALVTGGTSLLPMGGSLLRR